MTGGEDPGIPQFPMLVYGVANVVVVGAVYLDFDREVWLAAAPFRRPARREVGAGLVATALGILFGWPLTTLLAEAIGVARYTVPSFTGSIGTVTVFLTAVVVAPIAEEILFRGVFLGLLLERSDSPVVAGGSSLLIFAGLHVFTAGLGGVINAFVLGLLLTYLRLRFDNLVGAWLMHLLNNLLEFLIGLSLLPSLYALS